MIQISHIYVAIHFCDSQSDEGFILVEVGTGKLN